MKVPTEQHIKAFATFDDLDTIVVVADLNGGIIYANAAVKHTLGYAPREIVGNDWWEFISGNAEQQEKGKEFVAAGVVLRTIDARHTGLFESKHKAKNGNIVWIQWAKSQTKEGYIVGVGQVITEKKETEERLKRYAQQIELLHTIDKIILSHGPIDNRIESVLEALEKNISFVCRTSFAVFDYETNTAKLYRKEKIKGRLTNDNITLPLNAIRSAKQLMGGKHFIVKDLHMESELSSTDIQNKADGIVSYLAMPVMYRENLIGALFLCSDTVNPFSSHDMTLAKDVSNSLSLAIEQARLEQSLIKKNAEKELLLKEIHHRVKNNLQVISSLLNMQSYAITDTIALEAFQKSKDRIKAMALIHTKLYESKNLSEIDFQEYLNQLIDSIAKSYSRSPNIKWSAKVSDIILDVDLSINLGLIITELVTNSFKHAFKENNKGIITVELVSIADSSYQLIVTDNGVGLPKEFKLGTSHSLGLEIVVSLTEQINGVLDFSSEKGTQFKITFKK